MRGPMQAYQKEFIELARRHDVLKFGEFTLKSGRVSPYFFNAGSFSSGGALAALGRCYARRIVESAIEFDVLFGPAYKGIPLAAAASIALADHHDRNIPWCFNRKEAKDHGEGGNLVGAGLEGNILVIDDVITTGTATPVLPPRASRVTPSIIKTAKGSASVGTGPLAAVSSDPALGDGTVQLRTARPPKPDTTELEPSAACSTIARGRPPAATSCWR